MIDKRGASGFKWIVAIVIIAAIVWALYAFGIGFAEGFLGSFGKIGIAVALLLIIFFFSYFLFSGNRNAGSLGGRFKFMAFLVALLVVFVCETDFFGFTIGGIGVGFIDILLVLCGIILLGRRGFSKAAGVFSLFLAVMSALQNFLPVSGSVPILGAAMRLFGDGNHPVRIVSMFLLLAYFFFLSNPFKEGNP